MAFNLPCFKSKAPTQPYIPTPPPGWSIRFSPGYGDTPTPLGGGWQIDFESAPASLHCVTKTVSGITGPLVFDFHISASPDAAWGDADNQWPTEGLAPNLRLFFQRRGDNLSAQGEYQFYRWYAVHHYVLRRTEGSIVSLVAPLSGEAWTSVYAKSGRDYPAEFAAAAQNCEHVGVVFGAGHDAAHGVDLRAGSARITCTGFSHG